MPRSMRGGRSSHGQRLGSEPGNWGSIPRRFFSWCSRQFRSRRNPSAVHAAGLVCKEVRIVATKKKAAPKKKATKKKAAPKKKAKKK